MPDFTQQDADTLKIPLDLLQKWETVMDNIWKFFRAYVITEPRVTLRNEDNTIFFKLPLGHSFKIFVNFVNNKYLSLHIEIEGHEDFEFTFTHVDQLTKEGLIKTVGNTLTFAENIKL